jgi:hypothetical protein
MQSLYRSALPRKNAKNALPRTSYN